MNENKKNCEKCKVELKETWIYLKKNQGSTESKDKLQICQDCWSKDKVNLWKEYGWISVEGKEEKDINKMWQGQEVKWCGHTGDACYKNCQACKEVVGEKEKPKAEVTEQEKKPEAKQETIKQPKATTSANKSEPTEPPKGKGGISGGMIALIVAVVAIGGGLAWYFLYYKKDKGDSEFGDE